VILLNYLLLGFPTVLNLRAAELPVVLGFREDVGVDGLVVLDDVTFRVALQFAQEEE